MTFRDILQRNRIPYRQSPSHTDEITLHCPFCSSQSSDRRFLLGVNTRSGAGHCWNASCGWKSRHAVMLLLRHFRISDRAEAGVDEIPDTPSLEPVTLPEDFMPLRRAEDDLDRMALNYLRRRGILPAQIASKNIGVSYTGRYAYRIVFPVICNKALKAIVARDFTGAQKPKYLGSLGEKFLFNFDSRARTCVLSEGAFKALRIEQVVGPDVSSAALLGHDLTPQQLEQIQNSACQKVILYPDPDSVGRKGVVTIGDHLMEEWKKQVFLVWPVLLPADEAPLADIQTALRSGMNKFSWGSRQRLLVAENRA